MAEIWGADVPVSLGHPRTYTDTEEVDMEGFVFTPQGLRVNITTVDRDEIVASGWHPRKDEVSPDAT